MIDVRPDHLEIIKDILKRYAPGCEVRAFGSRVTWTAKNHSDLDLAVVGKQNFDQKDMHRLKNAFEESDLPFRVDVLDWNAISPEFRQVIEKEYEVVQKGNIRELGIAGEWRHTTLGDFITLQRGHDLTDSERRPGKVPVMGSAGLNGFHDVAKSPGPGVIIGRSGASFGKAHYCTKSFWPHNTALYVTDFKGNEPRFVYYFLSSIDFSRYNSGSAQPSLNRNYLYSIPIFIPEPNEQRTIAHILGTLDDKIELNRRMNETLEAMVQALFKSWFVDFDPVRAKMEGRDTGLPKEIEELFPDKFEESELGEIPRGWPIVPLPRFIYVNQPKALKKNETSPYLDMANMPTNSARAKEVYSREFGSGMRFTNGDTLVARITPCLENGKTCFVDFLKPGQVGWGSTEYIVLRAIPPLPLEYTYFLARTDAFRSFAISNMTGTSGRQRVPADCFNNFYLPFPPTMISEYFGKFAKKVIYNMKVNDEESSTLATLRDILFPKLISGEIRVSTK